MSKSEHRIQDEIRLAVCSETPYLCFRCNAGKAWGGKLVNTPEYGPVIINPKRIQLMPEGFSDLLCFGPGAATAFIEVKDDTGKTREAQERFLSLMQSMGFQTGVARSAEDAIKIIKGE